MRKAADIRHQVASAVLPCSKPERAPSYGNASSAFGLHRDLGNQVVQRLCSCGMSNAIGKGTGLNAPTLISKLRATSGSGEPLPEPAKTSMEKSLGTGLDQVRTHNNHNSHHMAETLGAEAFAVGRNIYFNAGRFAPESATGKKLLAHELVHTIQQGFHSGEIPDHLPISHVDDPYERQADEVAAGIAGNPSREQSGPVSVQPLRTHRIQPAIQLVAGLQVAIYETKDHGDGYEDAPEEPVKMEANSLEAAGNKLTGLMKAAREMFSGDISIGQLSFYGHGAPGSQSVGAGEGWDSAKEISVESIAASPDAYKKIYAPLADGASVYLRGCQVGAEAKGLQLLQQVKSSCKALAGKDVEAYGWTGKSYHMRRLWYDWYEQTGEKVSSTDKIPKTTWDKLKEREKNKKK